MSDLCLMVDTTLSGVALGLSDLTSGEFIGSQRDEDLLGGSKALTEKFKKLTSIHQVSVKDINYVCVSTGPGSFTGIKVGLAFVYGLLRGMSDDALVLPVSSLGLIAKNLSTQLGEVAVFLPATKVRGALALASNDEQKTLDIEVNSTDLMNSLHGRTVVLLRPWLALQSELEKYSIQYELYETKLVMEEAIKTMAAKAKHSYEEGEYTKKLPLPFYLRKSAAEEKLFQKGV